MVLGCAFGGQKGAFKQYQENLSVQYGILICNKNGGQSGFAYCGYWVVMYGIAALWRSRYRQCSGFKEQR